MSAEYKKDNGFTYLYSNSIHPYDLTLIESMFDMQTTYDEIDIQENMKENNIYKKSCLVRTILFPLDLLVTFLVMGPKEAKIRWKTQKVCWKFMRNKITLQQFKIDVVNTQNENN